MIKFMYTFILLKKLLSQHKSM